MIGKNCIIFNQATMKEIVAYYLVNHLIKGDKIQVTSVKSDKSNPEQFKISLDNKKEDK